MPSRNQADIYVEPLDEQWPNIRFLGLGAWWAWIWLCYNSTTVTGLFSAEARPSYVLAMYLLSTPAIALAMLLASAFGDKVESHLGSKGIGLAFGILAMAATATLELSGMLGSDVLFAISSVLTGIGTSFICLRAGRLYGSVGLGESLTAGALSIVFAALLYFTGVALPSPFGCAFAAALPLVAVILLNLDADDSFLVQGGVEVGTPEEKRARTRSLVRVIAAAGIIAFSAGFGKGISSMFAENGVFADIGAICTLGIGLIGVAMLCAIAKRGAVFSVTSTYSALILVGVAVSLGSCGGFDIAYLAMGKEALWLILSVLLAYLAFRYSMSTVRIFGVGQAVYFICSTAGWVTGFLLAPYYALPRVAIATSLGIAFLIVVVVVCVLPTSEVGKIVRTAHRPASRDEAGEGSQGALAPVSPDACEDCGGEGECEQAPDLSSCHALREPSAQSGQKRSAADASPYGHAADPVYGLSKRELEIMALFAQGRSANWIAENQCISKNTVRTHLRSVYAKLDVHTRQELLDFIAKGRETAGKASGPSASETR